MTPLAAHATLARMLPADAGPLDLHIAQAPLGRPRALSAERTVVLVGTLSTTPTAHRVGPAWGDVLAPEPADGLVARLVVPVLRIDGAALGLPRALVVVHSLYRGGALHYHLAADGRLHLAAASRAALLAWQAESARHGIDVFVDGVAAWHAPWLALTAWEVDGPRASDAGARPLVLEAWRREVAQQLARRLLPEQPPWAQLPLVWIPEPVWLQAPEPPVADQASAPGPLAFVGQLDASRFSDWVADTELYLFANAGVDHVALVGQAS